MAMTEPVSPPIIDDESTDNSGFDSANDDTWKVCTQPGCGQLWKPGPDDHGRRSKCDAHYAPKGGKARASRDETKTWTIEDAISVPLSRSEKEVAQRVTVLIRLVGGIVYRVNLVDGLIIGHHADKIGEGLVIEARTSETLKKMVDAMATFSGAGPLAIVVVSMTMQIAANHHVPVIGDLARVPDEVLVEAERIRTMRERSTMSEPIKASAVDVPSTPTGVGFAECPQCHRRAIGVPGASVTCTFCMVPVRIPV